MGKSNRGTSEKGMQTTLKYQPTSKQLILTSATRKSLSSSPLGETQAQGIQIACPTSSSQRAAELGLGRRLGMKTAQVRSFGCAPLPPSACSRESPHPHSCYGVPPPPHLHAFRHLRHFRHRWDGAKLLECGQCRAGCCHKGSRQGQRETNVPHACNHIILNIFFCRDLVELHHSWSPFPG